jgi:hypothetical protein
MFNASYHSDRGQYNNREWSISGQKNGPAVVAQYFLAKSARPILCKGGVYNREGGTGWASTWLWPRDYLLRQKNADRVVRNVFLEDLEEWEWDSDDDNFVPILTGDERIEERDEDIGSGIGGDEGDEVETAHRMSQPLDGRRRGRPKGAKDNKKRSARSQSSVSRKRRASIVTAGEEDQHPQPQQDEAVPPAPSVPSVTTETAAFVQEIAAFLADDQSSQSYWAV